MLSLALVVAVVLTAATTTAAPVPSVIKRDDISIEECGLHSPPCQETENVGPGDLYVTCPALRHVFFACDHEDHVTFYQCPRGQEWHQDTQQCQAIEERAEPDPAAPAYNPCTTAGVRYYPYDLDPRMFIDCGGGLEAVLKTCPDNLYWNVRTDTCDYAFNMGISAPPGGVATTTPRYVGRTSDSGLIVIPIVTQNPVVTYTPYVTVTNAPVTTTTRSTTTTSTGFPAPVVDSVLSSGFAEPCTRDRVNANDLYWPYPGYPHVFIQCNLAGVAMVVACPPGFIFESTAHTCVVDSVG